jgi:hypothetical protein
LKFFLVALVPGIYLAVRMLYQRKWRHPEGDFGTVGGPGDRASGGCLGPAVGRTEHGSPIAPADQLAGAIGESALHPKQGPCISYMRGPCLFQSRWPGLGGGRGGWWSGRPGWLAGGGWWPGRLTMAGVGGGKLGIGLPVHRPVDCSVDNIDERGITSK